MIKTMADLKRDAKSGKIFAEMVIRDGSTDIPERLKGKRKIVDANSVGIKFLNNDGKPSELRIEAASLLEYTDEHIIVFSPGLRELNGYEKALFARWEELRNPKQEEIDLLSDGNVEYWRRRHFFTDAGYEYLLGHETKKGMKYDYNTKMVRDNKIKGDVCMKYILVKE